ncbi:MAG: hypothetical protein FD171_2156 [Actinobacteria bacterium]|nr:MAG: hypothetical protein FD171_2156 [Actinomycetota bacterium]
MELESLKRTLALAEEAARDGRLDVSSKLLAGVDIDSLCGLAAAATFFARGNVRCLLGDDAAALGDYEAAFSLYAAAGDSGSGEHAKCLLASAHALAGLGRGDDAIQRCLEALAVFDEAGLFDEATSGRVALAHLYVTAGKSADALALFSSASGPAGPLAELALADALRVTGLFLEAANHYRFALSRELPDDTRARALAGLASAVEGGADGLPGAGQSLALWLEAGEYVERTLAAADYQEESMGAYRERLPDAFAFAARSCLSVSECGLDPLELSERARSARLRELWGHRGAAKEPVPTEDIRTSLRPDELLVSVVMTPSGAFGGDVLVLSIDRQGFGGRELVHGALPRISRALGVVTGSVRDAVGRGYPLPYKAQDELRAALRTCGSILLDPVRDRLAHVRRVTFVPHGCLHGLPFASLENPDTGEPLVVSHDVGVLPQASLRPLLAARRTAAGGRTLIADSGAFGSASRAVESAGEFASAVDASGMSTHDVLEALQGAREALLFLHADFDELDPASSALLVGAGGTERLTGLLIAESDLALELCLALACESGALATSKGEAILGLSPALLVVARQVVVSLWPLDERVAVAFLRLFLEEWDASEDAVAATSAVQRIFLDVTSARHPGALGFDASSPFNWSGFTALS